MSSTFKLIAVKVEEGCAPHIQKNLEGGWYLFDKDYTIDEELDSPKLKKDRQVPDNFFSTEEGKSPSPTINIHAIVGMNGSGKSALIDFILRLINNYACAFLGDIEKKYSNLEEKYPRPASDLVWVNGIIIGDLYFSVNGELHHIKQKENRKMYLDGQLIKFNRQTLSGAFYTILLNYSIYSLNISDYAEEAQINEDFDTGEHWLDGLLQNSYGYQTPCVLNPWRSWGNIDINTENKLSKDRLIAIALMNKEGNIGGTYKLTKLKLSIPYDKTLNKSKKLSEKMLGISYNDVFQKVREAWIKTLNPQNINLAKELALDYIAYKSMAIDFNYIFMEQVLTQDKKASILEDDGQKNISNLVYRLQNEKSHITNKIHQTIAFLQSKNCWSDEFTEDIGSVAITDIKPTAKVPHEVLMVDYYYPILEELISPKYNPNNQWDKIQTVGAFITHFTDNVHVPWKKYALEITDRINNLIDRIRKIEEPQKRGKKSRLDYADNQEKKSLEEAVDNLMQILLSSKYYIARRFQEEWKKDSSEPQIDVIRKSIEVSLGDLKEGQQERAIYLVPPPIFDVELLVSKDGGKEIPLSKLSSGEKQLLYSSSSYLYHLLNLDSVHESLSDRIKYDYVNLICDEIELYFHPEYQRQFVDYMLKSIRSMNLKHIKAINILLSTHSPFILSDIPDAHVLYLKEGKPVNRQGETFGANIHELLRDAFFLNGMPIGDFAQKKILKLNERIKSADEHSQFEQLEKEITLIGEPILRRQLRRLLEEKVMTMGSIRLATKTELLENRVRTLESEIRRLKKKRENYD